MKKMNKHEKKLVDRLNKVELKDWTIVDCAKLAGRLRMNLRTGR